MRAAPFSILRAVGRSRGPFVFSVLQIALGLAAVVQMLVLGAGFKRIGRRDTGLDERHVFFVTVDSRSAHEDPVAHATKVREALAAIPGVRTAARIEWAPLGWDVMADRVSRDRAGHPTIAWILGSDPGGPEALGLPLRQGRFFVSEDAGSDDPRAMLTESLARQLFGDQPAVGQHIQTASHGTLHIVGVAGDALIKGIFAPRPTHGLFYLTRPGPWQRHLFALRTTPEARDRAPALVQAALARFDAAIQVQPFDRYKTTLNRNFGSALIIFWTTAGVVVVVILLGSMGIASFLVAERRRQIGIRRALGGSQSDIVHYFLLENWLTTTLGILLGILPTYAICLLSRRLDPSLRFEWQYLLVGAILFWATGLLAALVPARSGARVPPTVASRAL